MLVLLIALAHRFRSASDENERDQLRALGLGRCHGIVFLSGSQDLNLKQDQVKYASFFWLSASGAACRALVNWALDCREDGDSYRSSRNLVDALPSFTHITTGWSVPALYDLYILLWTDVRKWSLLNSPRRY